MLKKHLTNNGLMIALAFGFFAIGVILSIVHQNFQWLSRFGALIICAGVITLARPSILGEDIKSHVVTQETGLSYLDPAHWAKSGLSVPEYVKEDMQSRTAVGWLGPLMCFAGTAINGFGDLLNRVVGYP